MNKKISLLCCMLALLAASPVWAKPKESNSTVVPATEPAPIPSTSPSIGTDTPVPDAAVVPPPQSSAKPSDLSPSKVTAGDIELSGMNAKASGSTIEFSLTAKNNSKNDDKIIGAASWDGADITVVTNADGKNKDGPVEITLPASNKEDIKLTIKNVTSKQRASGEVPVTFYFRRSPNTTLKVELGGGDGVGTKIMGLFGK